MGGEGSGIRAMRILGRANYKKGAWPLCGTADGSLRQRVVEGTEVTVEGGEVRAAEQGPRRSRWGARPLGNWETRISLCFCKTPGRNGREFSKKAAEGRKPKFLQRTHASVRHSSCLCGSIKRHQDRNNQL